MPGSFLPLIISVPHGGMEIPPVLRSSLALSEADLRMDGDAGTPDIYRIGDRGVTVVTASIARAFVDLNRGPRMLPPQFPDGVIKTITSYGQRIYLPGRFPSRELIGTLLRRYYHPYHRRLRDLARSGRYRLGLDCHSMADLAPPGSLTPGRTRPLVNLGDDRGRSCPPDWTARLATAFRNLMGVGESDVAVNDPFSGGYITRSHGRQPLPWIQVEINRRLYLRIDRQGRVVLNRDKMRVLNRIFHRCLGLLIRELDF